MGTQSWRNNDGSLTHKAIFSCWDGDATHATGWVGPNCERFGGEGVGSHCLVDIPLRANASFTVTVAAAGHNSSGAFWRGTVRDDERNSTLVIGTLFHPNFDSHVGYGMMQVAAADFQEYFESSDCANQAVSGIGLIGPTFNNGSIVPSQASADYVAGCNYSNVGACIPGFGCGAPRVFMLAGGYTNRTQAKGVPLW